MREDLLDLASLAVALDPLVGEVVYISDILRYLFILL
jgi:hypothetical protein